MATIKNAIDPQLQADLPRLDIVPTSSPTPLTISVVERNNGTRDITVTWSYTQSRIEATHIGLLWNVNPSSAPAAPTVSNNSGSVILPISQTSYTFEGVHPEQYYRLGIVAGKQVESSWSTTAVVSPTTSPNWQVSKGTSNNTNNINGVLASAITAAMVNFNSSNDQNGNAISAPTGLVLTQTLNSIGSVDLTLSWNWTGNEFDIDGFGVYVYASQNSTPYTLGNPSDTVYPTLPSLRSLTAFGVAQNQYYTIGVRAYRVVDTNVNASGFILSSITQLAAIRPNATPNITANVGGQTSTAIANTVTGLSDLNNNGKLTPNEKQELLRKFNEILQYKPGLISQATSFSITTELSTYTAKFQALADFLNNGSTWTSGDPFLLNSTNILTTSDVTGITLDTKILEYINAFEALNQKLNLVSSTKATWENVDSIPYSAIYSTDEATQFNLNPAFASWSGAYPDGYTQWTGEAPTKETTIRNNNRFSARWTTDGTQKGMQRTITFAPLPAKFLLSGSVDFYLVSRVSGLPAFLINFFENANFTGTQVNALVYPNPITGVWQKVPFTVQGHATLTMQSAIIYFLASWVGGQGVFNGDVIFGGFRFTIQDGSFVNNKLQQFDDVGGATKPENNATKGAPAGSLINGVLAETVQTYAADARNGTIKYRTSGVPTNNPSPTSATVTDNTVGGRNIRLDWGAYTQGTNQADFLLLFYKEGSGAPTINDACVQFNVNTSASYHIFTNVDMTKAYSAGIAAARRTENGIEIGAIVTHASWAIAAGTLVNAATSVGGQTASNVATTVTDTINFRNIGAPTNNPVVAANSVSAISKGGTVDVTINWTYTQGALPADEFWIYANQGTGTITTSSPLVAKVGKDARSYSFIGVPADKDYRAGVVAVRNTANGPSAGALVTGFSYAAQTVTLNSDQLGGTNLTTINNSITQAGTTATWAGTSGIPSSIYNTDDATTYGINPSFEDWAGIFPDQWTDWLNGSTIIKETSPSYVKVGKNAVRFTPSGGNVGIHCIKTFPALPAKFVISGSIDIFIVSRTSGLPAFYFNCYADTGLTQHIYGGYVQPSPTVGSWQKVNFTFRGNGTAQPQAFVFYIMGSYAALPSGGFTGSVIFDNINFSIFNGVDFDNNEQQFSVIKGTETVVANATNGNTAFNATDILRLTTTPNGVFTIGSVSTVANNSNGRDIIVNFTFAEGNSPCTDFLIVYKQGTTAPTLSDSSIVIPKTSTSWRFENVDISKSYTASIIARRVGNSVYLQSLPGSAHWSVSAGSAVELRNTQIVIAANGALSGAGGGQVTIGGLGYSGELDATKGANASNLKVGTGVNLLPNTEFANGNILPWAQGWNPDGANIAYFGATSAHAGVSWNPINGESLEIYQFGRTSGATSDVAVDIYPFGSDPYKSFAISPGDRIELFTWVAAHRCAVEIYVAFYDSNLTYLSISATGKITPGTGGTLLSNWTKIGCFGVAPANASKLVVVFRKYNTAVSQGDSYAWFFRPYCGFALANQTEYSLYTPGVSRATEGAPSGTKVGNTLAQTVESNANNAYAQAAAMIDDNVLSPGTEKAFYRSGWDSITAQRTGLLAQASSLGVSSTAYATAYQNLANFLHGGTWSSGIPTYISDAQLGTSTNLNGATGRSLLAAMQSATTDLQSALDAKAATVSTWNGTSGIPLAQIYSVDDATALGLNSTYSDWTGALPANYFMWVGANPTKETSIVRIGKNSVRYSVNGGDTGILVPAYATFSKDIIISGSIYIYLVSRTSGQPTFSALAAKNGIGGFHWLFKVSPLSTTTGVWQKIDFVGKGNGVDSFDQINFYLMASWASDSPSRPFVGDVIFGNFTFDIKDGNVFDNRNQLYADVKSKPANIASLTGTEAIQNSQIAISSGLLSGIGAGNNTPVANSLISVTDAGLLTGIAANASVGNNIDGLIRNPGGGMFTTSTSAFTGALKITLPVFFTDTMLKFVVDIYEFSTGLSCLLSISGFNGSSGNAWVGVTANVIGGNTEYPVYFGHNGTKAVIWIGGTTETWSYPQVQIKDVAVSYFNYSKSMWESGWVIDFSSAARTNVTATVLDTFLGADLSKSSKQISTTQIVNAAVTAAKTAIAAIDPNSGNLTANSVTANAIAAGAVTAIKIAANTITANEIAANAITTDKIAANTITAAKMGVSDLSSMSANLGFVTAGTLDATGYVRARGGVNIPGYGNAAIAGNDTYGQKYGGIFFGGSAGGAGVIGIAGNSNYGGQFYAGGGNTACFVQNTSGDPSGVGLSVSHLGGGTALAVSGNMTISTTNRVTNLNAHLINGFYSDGICTRFETNSGDVTPTTGAGSGGKLRLVSTVSGYTIVATDSYTMSLQATSDERLKEDIWPEIFGKAFIQSLSPVSYRYKANPKIRHHGFIANRMIEYTGDFNDSLSLYHENSNTYGTDYISYIGPIVKSLKETWEEIDELKKEIAELKLLVQQLLNNQN